MTHLQRTERQCWVADQYAPVWTDRECIIALWTVYRLILDLLSGCTIKQAFVTSGSWLLCLSTTPFRDNINRLWQWFKSDRPVTAAHLKKKILYTSDTMWNVSKPYHCLYLEHDRSLNRNAHWQKPEARRLPHFFFHKLHTFVSFHSKFLPTSVFIVSKDVSVEFCSERHDATAL